MTVLPIYGGPIKRALIQRAFGMCGQSVTDYELTPEEYDLALQCMNDVASTLGSGFSYNMPRYGVGKAEDESGLVAGDVLGFTCRIAQEIGPNIGKTVMLNGHQATAVSSLIARYQDRPQMRSGMWTPYSGNRYYRGVLQTPVLDGDTEVVVDV